MAIIPGGSSAAVQAQQAAAAAQAQAQQQAAQQQAARAQAAAADAQAEQRAMVQNRAQQAQAQQAAAAEAQARAVTAIQSTPDTVAASPTGIRILNPDTGKAEVGVYNNERRSWVPVSTVSYDQIRRGVVTTSPQPGSRILPAAQPSRTITPAQAQAQPWDRPFKVSGYPEPSKDNSGLQSVNGRIDYNGTRWVLPENTRVVHEPGNYNTELAVTQTGKPLSQGGYDAARDVFVVATPDNGRSNGAKTLGALNGQGIGGAVSGGHTVQDLWSRRVNAAPAGQNYSDEPQGDAMVKTTIMPTRTWSASPSKANGIGVLVAGSRGMKGSTERPGGDLMGDINKAIEGFLNSHEGVAALPTPGRTASALNESLTTGKFGPQPLQQGQQKAQDYFKAHPTQAQMFSMAPMMAIPEGKPGEVEAIDRIISKGINWVTYLPQEGARGKGFLANDDAMMIMGGGGGRQGRATAVRQQMAPPETHAPTAPVREINLANGRYKVEGNKIMPDTVTSSKGPMRFSEPSYARTRSAITSKSAVSAYNDRLAVLQARADAESAKKAAEKAQGEENMRLFFENTDHMTESALRNARLQNPAETSAPIYRAPMNESRSGRIPQGALKHGQLSRQAAGQSDLSTGATKGTLGVVPQLLRGQSTSTSNLQAMLYKAATINQPAVVSATKQSQLSQSEEKQSQQTRKKPVIVPFNLTGTRQAPAKKSSSDNDRTMKVVPVITQLRGVDNTHQGKGGKVKVPEITLRSSKQDVRKAHRTSGMTSLWVNPSFEGQGAAPVRFKSQPKTSSKPIRIIGKRSGLL